MRDIDTGVTTRISEPPGGQAEGDAYGSYNATITTLSGYTFVTFVSDANNLVSGDTNGAQDVFLKVVSSGDVFRVSNANSGAQSDNGSGPYSSTETAFGGLVMLFSSHDNLTSDASGSGEKLYLADGQGNVALASGAQANGNSYEAGLKYPYIAYTTTASNLDPDDTNGVADVYVYNHQTQTSTLISRGLNGLAGNGASGFYARVTVADDNTPYVTFSSVADNLVAGDTNGQIDFFIKNLVTGELVRLSEGRSGIGGNGTSTGFATGGSNMSHYAFESFSSVFTSDATNLVGGDTNGFTDIFRVNFYNQDSVVTASAGDTAAVEQVASVIDAALTVTDVDTLRPVEARVQITGNYVAGEDVLQFTTIGTITGSFNATLGILTLSGNGTVAEYEAALRTVKYLNTSDAPNTANRTISFSVDDGGAWSAAATKTVGVAGVNDSPTGTDKTVVIGEDASHSFTASDFGFSDPKDGNALAAVIVTTLPTIGVLKLNGAVVTAGQSIAAGALGNLVWTPPANANGVGLTSFGFKVVDTGGTANGGQNTDATANTITFNVTSVNDAPVITSNGATRWL